MKWIIIFLVGLSLNALADHAVATYRIGWDNGDGDAQLGRWHTVPKLTQGNSTIYFDNQGTKADVQLGASEEQVLKIDIGTDIADLLAFKEVSSGGRHYIIRGEARCENVKGWVSLALGVSNSNYAGYLGMASSTNGQADSFQMKQKWWQGTEDWKPFVISCRLPPATLLPASADPNHFIAEMNLKEIDGARGTFYLRNLQMEVFAENFAAPDVGQTMSNAASFIFGAGAGVLGCIVFLRFHTRRLRRNHELELRRIAALDASQR